MQRPVTGPHKHLRATATITVHSSETKPFDESISPGLHELQLRETFVGTIAAESTARALQLRRDDGSTSMVSMQRVVGSLDGRHGTFVLQGSEVVQSGKIKASWFVVSGSGTGELSGLRGEGGFEGDFGQGSSGWLEYWFE